MQGDEEPKPLPPVRRRYFDERLGAWVTVYATPLDAKETPYNPALPTKPNRREGE